MVPNVKSIFYACWNNCIVHDVKPGQKLSCDVAVKHVKKHQRNEKQLSLGVFGGLVAGKSWSKFSQKI